MKTKLLLFITAFSMCLNSQSQDLSSHQWKDRLILILVDDASNATYQKQIEELHSDEQGLQDRKLLIYTVLPDKFKRSDIPNQGWTESGELYSEYKKSRQPFEIVLIGLDGGVKLQLAEFLSNKKLFGRIDQMPMRRRELQDNEDRPGEKAL